MAPVRIIGNRTSTAVFSGILVSVTTVVSLSVSVINSVAGAVSDSAVQS